MQTIKFFRTMRLCAGLLALSFIKTQAASITNADVPDNLNLGTSWVGGTAAGSGDVAIWDHTVQVNTTKALGTNLAWAGIQVLDPAALITISAGNTLTNGASGIDMSLATNSLTFSNAVVLGASQTWNVTNGMTLTAGGVVSGSSLLTLNNGGNNGGSIILGAANTYTGGTVINSGVVQPNVATSFGTGAVTNNGGTLLLNVFPNAGIMVNAFNVTGTSVIDMFNRSVSDVLDGAWSGNGTIIVTNDTASGSTLTFGGASGGNMANFTGSVIVLDTNSAGTASAGALRFNNGGSDVNTGNANCSFNLGGTVSAIIFENRDAGTMNIGELKGGPLTFLTGQTSGSGTETWSIGGKNTSTTFAGTIKNQSGTALSALTKVGTGTFTLSGNNTYTGATTVSGGTLQIGDGVTSGAGQLGTANVTDNATLVFARPDAISVANVISGTGNLVQAGANVLTLTSANTYTGTTIVTNGGTILVGAAGAIPAATALTLGGSGTAGTLDLAGNNVQVSALNTGSGATGGAIGSSGASIPTLLIVNATNGASTYNGVIQDTNALSSGSGIIALTVQNGKLTLGGVNTYSGSTTISNGNLTLSTGASISSSTIILNGSGSSVLDVSAVGGLTLSSGYVLAASGSMNGNVTAANCLITPGTNGTVATLTCSNNLSLNGGVTNHFDLSANPASGNDQIAVGGALNLSGVNTIEINPLIGSLGAGTYKLFSYSSKSGTVANLQLAGSPGSGLNAALNVTGTEVDLVVTSVAAPFVWRGDGSLNQWDYTTANWRSNNVASLFTDGDFAVFDNSGSNTPAIDITDPVSPATVTVNASVNYTFGSVGGTGKITGIASLTKTNTGTLTLLTANDYTGGTTINMGTIQVSDGSASGAMLGYGDVVDNASLVFNQPDNYDFTNVISGTGNLTQQGSGTMTFSGNNTYSGLTTISAGTLQVGDGNTSGTLGTNTVTDNAALAFNRSDSLVQSGLITGSGALTVLAGTVAVTASNNFSGATTINPGGTLQLGNGGTTGSVLASNITDNGTLAFDHSVDKTNVTPITGSGGISKLAGNTLTLTAANNYNGNTSISAGTLKIGAAGTVPSGSGFGNVVLNGGASTAGTLDMNGFDVTVDGITGSSNSVLGQIVNNAGSTTNVLMLGAGDAGGTTFSGAIEDNNNGGGGKIALVKIGAGTMTFSMTNSYTGGTVISNGVLATGNALANGSGGFSAFGPTNNPIVFDGGGLALYNNASDGGSVDTYAFYNPLIVSNGQTGTLTMFQRGDLYSTLTGSGTLNTTDPGSRGTLAGNWSAFTGMINILSGQFRINNSFGYSNAVININDGADLDTGADGNPGASGQTIDIGELDGTSLATIGNGGKPSPNQTWRVGWKNTTSTFAGTIVNGTTTGSTGDALVKVGTGTLILTGQNTYAGSTTISNGVLALASGANGDGSIGSSATINITPGAFLDVSGRSDGTLPLGSSQTLEGRGTIRGSLDASGIVAPGDGPGGNTGTLTVTNVVTLESSSTAWMKLNRANSPNSDRLAVSNSISYGGGTLIVTNIGATLQVGDTFTLFSSPAYANSFGAIVLPALSGAQTWNTNNLALNGTISVVGATPPSFGSIAISGGDIVLNATNGTPGGPVTVLTSTNVALPLAQWTTVITTNFDGSGNFTYPVSGALSSGQPRQFYILQTQ